MKFHTYQAKIVWTGNKGPGTIKYDAYERSHDILIDGKPTIHASSDTPFSGDATKINPEDFLLSATASCHMLWYLHLCADAGIVVTTYEDNLVGKMIQLEHGGGHFESITLCPKVSITDASKVQQAKELHNKANERCFIANSLNFKVNHEPIIEVV